MENVRLIGRKVFFTYRKLLQIQFHVSPLVLESMGRIPLGLYQGNTNDLGEYDDCLAIAHELNGDVLHTKYCYAGLVIPLQNISFTKRTNLKTEFTVSETMRTKLLE